MRIKSQRRENLWRHRRFLHIHSLFLSFASFPPSSSPSSLVLPPFRRRCHFLWVAAPCCVQATRGTRAPRTPDSQALGCWETECHCTSGCLAVTQETHTRTHAKSQRLFLASATRADAHAAGKGCWWGVCSRVLWRGVNSWIHDIRATVWRPHGVPELR